MTKSSEELGSRLLRAVEIVAISSEDAIAITDQYVHQSRQKVSERP